MVYDISHSQEKTGLDRILKLTLLYVVRTYQLIQVMVDQYWKSQYFLLWQLYYELYSCSTIRTNEANFHRTANVEICFKCLNFACPYVWWNKISNSTGLRI